MYSHGVANKRARPDTVNGNVSFTGLKRSKEMESGQPGLGSKSKPCTKFFSTSGCPFGEGCHFLHHVPGGYNAAAAHMTSLGSTALPPAARSLPVGGPTHATTEGPLSQAPKTRLCNKYNTAEGCKFGEKCHFAHGERELGRPPVPSHEHQFTPAMAAGGLGARFEPPPPAPPLGPAASFGASATAKISVDASLAGAIIGKGGANTKLIWRSTGAKFFIKEHESDPNLKNIELEGTFDQIKQATAMVRDLIVNISSAPQMPAKPTSGFNPPGSFNAGGAGFGSNLKTKLCDNFSKGTCTFGDRCHFAHGASELRKTAA